MPLTIDLNESEVHLLRLAIIALRSSGFGLFFRLDFTPPSPALHAYLATPTQSLALPAAPLSFYHARVMIVVVVVEVGTYSVYDSSRATTVEYCTVTFFRA